jgi:hypothetical protein
MEFIFHNSYTILEWFSGKSYSCEAMFLLGWSHRLKYTTVVITNWLTVAKYPDLKWKWNFFLFMWIFFFPLSATIPLPVILDYRTPELYPIFKLTWTTFSSETDGPNEPIDPRRHLWKVLYKNFCFRPDPLSNKSTIGNSCFWLVEF